MEKMVHSMLHLIKYGSELTLLEWSQKKKKKSKKCYKKNQRKKMILKKDK
jgi:hypothetical protein